MNAKARWVAALFVVAMFIPALSTAQSAEPQKRTPPPKSDPAPAQARPSRKPTPATPPAKAVPRPPASPQPAQPAPRPPASPSESRTLIYPHYFYDFDFVYRFPYGVYPYSTYPYSPYPYPPYGYPVPVPAPGCVTAEGETAASGAVRLDIPQKEAAVYVDGFYVGTVGDLDGVAEPLPLVPGPHHLELRATGYQTLAFDVNIQAGKTITYRSPMQPVSSTTS